MRFTIKNISAKFSFFKIEEWRRNTVEDIEQTSKSGHSKFWKRVIPKDF